MPHQDPHDALIETRDIPRPRERPPEASSFSPVGLLHSAQYRMYAGLGFGVFSLLFSLVFMFLTVQEMKSTERVFVIDPSNTIYTGQLDKIDLASPVYERIALLATQSFYQRSPVGFDLPKLLQALYMPLAYDKAEVHLNSEIADIRTRNLHQKPEISRIDALRERGEIRIIRVTGQLIRSGSFEGVPLSESEPFRFIIALRPNENLAERGEFPFRVSDLKVDR